MTGKMGRSDKQKNTQTTQHIPSPPASPRQYKADLAASSPSTSADNGRQSSPECAGVRDLLASISLRTSLMGKAVDALSGELQKAAILTQAICAAEQINLLKKELGDRDEKREQRIKEEKDKLRMRVEEHVRNVLMHEAGAIIEEQVRKNLKNKVNKQLAASIPESLKAKITTNQNALWDARVELHNFEMKRYHAAIPPHSEYDRHPIKAPLPRRRSPLAIVTGAPPSPVSQRTKSGTTASPSPVQMPVEPPAPSPLFPQDLMGLFRLTLGNARKIAEYYDLQVPGDGTGDVSREQQINDILTAIGVPRKMQVPQGQTPSERKKRPTIITSVSSVSTIRSALSSSS
ncbi:hypothetical protein NEOLEDRAFT_1132012 [Neolentinus lepideus HHB14362 ss-1]|uniref:Uncharacterized protein n=1 Tax=Neolentinus lepideus HHB14362 ss-1 TaxID=1314782 RepID=A0A165TDH1_9AGAM|nr:hypothetical protein NEOLEDRAFT_1132012 [Neolentinus lepideus HHB14362 ss-1]